MKKISFSLQVPVWWNPKNCWIQLLPKFLLSAQKWVFPIYLKLHTEKPIVPVPDHLPELVMIMHWHLVQKTGQKYKLPTTSDIHAHDEAAPAAAFVDVLQIPAFLCRQTDLLIAAAETGKVINVKKGQFLSGPAMKFAAEKIRKAGNDKIIFTERGTTFGYQDLVVDYRNIPWMQEHGVPVVMDCTHSLQQPNQTAGITGGNPNMISTIAMAAIAAGADGLFIETHPDPAHALSDGATYVETGSAGRYSGEAGKTEKSGSYLVDRCG